MAAYLTVDDFKLASVAPGEVVVRLEAIAPGFIAKQLELASSAVDARLRKRYAAPFESPYPIKVTEWVTHIVTRSCFVRRGVEPDDRMWPSIEKAANDALAEIKEAADAKDGLFDLPLRSDTTSTGISKGGPLGYSEASPYVAHDRQRRTGREEDRNGTGSGDGS